MCVCVCVLQGFQSSSFFVFNAEKCCVQCVNDHSSPGFLGVCFVGVGIPTKPKEQVVVFLRR